MKLIIEATKEMLFCAQRSSEWCVIDARSSDIYMGWKHGNEKAGHIPYAKFFSAQWLDTRWRESAKDYEVRLKIQMESQGIRPDKNIIVYDENALDAEIVLNYFSENGFDRLFYFNLNNWDGDLYKYPNRKLMMPMWMVNDIAQGRGEQYFPGCDIKIFEISWKEPSEHYLETHVPGAIHVDSNEFEIPPMWIMKEDDELIDFAMQYGVTPETVVIVYGNTRLNFGAAAKLAVVFRYLGIQQVYCMNGIIKNWLMEGYPTEAGNVKRQPCRIDKKRYILDRSHALHMKDVKEILNDPDKGKVIDIRNWKEYIGEESGYPYLDKAGRIPGTQWCYYPDHYMTPNVQMGNLEVMLKSWEKAKINLEKTMAFFCGSASWGAAACKTFANVAGFPNATIYEGGWCEWCVYPENPVETGIPEEYADYNPEEFHVSELITEESCHVM